MYIPVKKYRNISGEILENWQICKAGEIVSPTGGGEIVSPTGAAGGGGGGGGGGTITTTVTTPVVTPPNLITPVVTPPAISQSCPVGSGYHWENNTCVKDVPTSDADCVYGKMFVQGQGCVTWGQPDPCPVGYITGAFGICNPVGANQDPDPCSLMISGSHNDKTVGCKCDAGYHIEGTNCVQDNIAVNPPAGGGSELGNGSGTAAGGIDLNVNTGTNNNTNTGNNNMGVIYTPKDNNNQVITPTPTVTAGSSFNPIYIVVGLAIILLITQKSNK